MSNEFKREDRYIVIKRSDLKKVPVAYRSHLVEPMFSLLSHLPRRECLVIESDWPEYEPTWAAIEARTTGAAPQPPALGGVPDGIGLQQIMTEALMGMIAAVTSTSPPTNEPPPPFIQSGIDRAVSRISAHLVPLQAEIERLKAQVSEVTTYRDNAVKKIERLRNELTGTEKERDQLKARCDELAQLSPEAFSVMKGMVEHCINVRACMGMDEGFKSFDPDEEHDFVKELRAFALSKPAGSEQV